ncbi:hypothetical protein F5I97DRAFT_1861378 [Phlebopus sp. FC_14]|nr:hypothetical protein F5I97DRAFT_1861378 [Phlebopus sp. FC_14]
MDDDFGFESSVWAASTDPLRSINLPSAPPLTTSSPAPSHDHYDDFDDFHTPPQTQNPSVAQDDDFADFGDFGDVQESDDPFTFDEADPNMREEDAPADSSQRTWNPLRLSPLPSKEDLSLQIEETLGPVWSHGLPGLTSDEDIRQVGGIGQILITQESRELYTMLLNSPPLMEPVNWIRSHIRQQHLISLGLPVNLDELLPHSSTKALPPLHISTRPTSVPPGVNGPPRSTPASRSNSRAGTPRAGTPQASTRSGMSSVMQLVLGPKPQLNEKKIEDLLQLDSDQLNLLPLPKLERYLAELRSETTNTSSLLTYHLQTRDALQQDSETYNKLIAELVSEAQRGKHGKGRMAGKRSGTVS